MKKKVLALILATIMMLSITTGCSKANEATEEDKASITSQEVEKEETSYPETVIIKDVEGELQFDFDEAMKNIYFAGKKTSMPTTLAELGEGFEFRGGQFAMQINGVSHDCLMYKDIDMAIVSFEDDAKDNYDNHSKIVGALCSRTAVVYEAGYYQGIYKFRVGFEMTVDEALTYHNSTSEERSNLFKERKTFRQEVIDYFGKPTIENKYTIRYVKDDDETQFIEFSVDDEDGLDLIQIQTK